MTSRYNDNQQHTFTGTQRTFTGTQRTQSGTQRTHSYGAAYNTPTTDETFTFGEREYKREALLSSTTGEAEIFLVSHEGRQYVLKLYYKGYYPSAQVLETLRSKAGNGLLVDIVDYGEWTSQSGDERFGVIMQYYSGGVLKGGELRGKGAELERIAIQAINAINYCHEIGILHKDVKPNNFIFTDESRQQIVLADFGIASTFSRDLQGNVIPFVNTNQNRTYIYASPEIFNLTVQRSDGKVEVEYTDIKSDYFALGMTLLVLWMGEAPFALLDERSLLKLKRGDRSGLPYPEDIPRHTRNLIKGLTIADPKKRWGYEEFTKWLKGEDVEVENSQSPARAMRILYNGGKGQVATSIRQLATFMLDDPALGEQYLYSGKISEWLGESGFPEWQMRIDSIIGKQYPKSRRSGLLAACYKMNPDLPFVGISGAKCYNNAQIARELTRNAEAYSSALREWDSPLYVYFASRSADTGTKFQPLFKTNPWIALWRLAYTLSPEAEFPFWSTQRNTVVWCATVDQLLEEYAASSQDRYASFNTRTPIGRYTPYLLTDESFMMWLAARDRDLAEKIRAALAEENSHSTDLYTYIFYLLDPTRNFFFEKNEGACYSAVDIGTLLNRDMVEYQVIGRYENNQHFYNEQHRRVEQLARYRDTKLYYYLKSRGDYERLFDYIDSCFDLRSVENRDKSGPYNSRIATLKVCRMLAGETFYYFPASGITITQASEISKVPEAELREELHKGFLMEWLSVQYQEGPDVHGNSAYDHRLIELMDTLEDIDPEMPEVQRYNRCRAEIAGNSSRLRGAIRKILRLKGVLVGYVLAVVLMMVAMIVGGVHCVATDDVFSYNWRTMAYIAAPLFVMMMIPPVQAFVNNLTKGILGSPLLFALVVSNVLVLGWEAVKLWIMPNATVAVPVIYGLFAALILYKCYYKRNLRAHRYKACISPDFTVQYVEPLVFTWRESQNPYKQFESSISAITREYGLYLRSVYKKLMSSVHAYGVWVVILAVVFCFISVPASRLTERIFPSLYTARSQKAATPDYHERVRLYICDVDNALTVRDAPSSRGRAIGSLNDEDLVEVVGFDGDYAEILYNGYIAYVLKKYIHPLDNTPQ